MTATEFTENILVMDGETEGDEDDLEIDDDEYDEGLDMSDEIEEGF